MPQWPMLIVYWGRWADATGAVGPWSATVMAGVEGWPDAAHTLPGAQQSVTVEVVGERRPARAKYIEHVRAMPLLPDAATEMDVLDRELIEMRSPSAQPARLLEEAAA